MSNPRRSYEYAQVDVFAESALTGNMLAIFTDATGLSAQEMQALARETNLAETAFIVPQDAAAERHSGVKVRIFTVQEELRFAGHPTLGTASWLHWNHSMLRGAEAITLDLPVGPITVRFDPQKEGMPGIFGTMQQNPPSFGRIHSAHEVAAALNLSMQDLDSTLPIQTVSTGMAFCIVPLRSLEVAERLKIPQHSAQAYLDGSDAKFFYCMAQIEEGTGHFAEARWHNRMQFYNGEDPATGSASGCAIAYLVHNGRAASGETVIFEQGVEIGRPSRIEARAVVHCTDGAGSATKVSLPDSVFVSGRTILVASGRFFLP